MERWWSSAATTVGANPAPITDPTIVSLGKCTPV
jgi:hypothetical protein